MTEKIKKPLNIFQRMLKITADLGVVEKWLNVQVSSSNSYKAVSERDVLDAVKPLEEKYWVYSYPFEREIIENETLTKTTEYQGTKKESTSLYMRIKVTYRFVNIDKPEEFIDTTVYGDGIDTGDKAPWKAMTYADKYALMKAYKISTGDDPDKEASPETWYKEKKLTKEESKKKLEEFKKKCETVNLDDKTETEKLLEEWRQLHKQLTEEDKKELTEYCVWIKNALEILKADGNQSNA